MAPKANHPTKRQAVLLDRLVKFCERCARPDLPLQVVRVVGYGSFFRGKDRPGDIDLAVFTGVKHPLFERFVEVVEGELQKFQPGLPLADRMRLLAASHAEPTLKESGGIFVEWLANVTEHMLYGQQTIVGNLMKASPSFYLDRLLHASLPGIRAKLTKFEDSHIAEVVHEVWTPETVDVRAEVERIWGRDKRADLLIEAVCFEKQARPYLLQIAVLGGIADRLVKSRIKALDDKPEEVWKAYDSWLLRTEPGFPGELCVRATDRIFDESGSTELPLPPGYVSPDFESLGDLELAQAVESKRQSLIHLRERTTVLRLLTNHLAYWAFCEKKKIRLCKSHYLFERVTKGISAREIKPGVVQEIISVELGRLGLS